MSGVRDLVAGFKAQFLAKLLSAIGSAVLLAALTRLLEPDGYGLFMLALTVFSTFQLVSRFGIPGSAGRYIAEFEETAPEQIPHIVRFSLLLILGALVLICLVVFVSYPYVVDLVGEPELSRFLLVGLVFLVLGTIHTYISKVLQGFEAIRVEAAMRITEPIGRLVFALGLVVAGFGVLGAYIGYIISSVLTISLGAGYLFFRLREFHRDGDIPPMESGLRRRIAEYSVPLVATNSAYVLDDRIDTLLVGALLSPVEVGFYVLSDRVVKFVETPMSALGFTISPMFGSEKAAGNIERISKIYEVSLVNTLLLYVPAAAGIILVAEPMIRLVFGAEYADASVVLQVLGPYIVFKAITKLTDNGLNYLGRARDRAIFRGVTAMLNVVLTVALIPVFGVAGAALATVITYGIYTGANVYVVSLELELRPRYLLKQLVGIGLITGVMSAVVFSLLGYVSGWITLFLVVGAGGGIWMILSVATGLLEVQKLVSAFRPG